MLVQAKRFTIAEYHHLEETNFFQGDRSVRLIRNSGVILASVDTIEELRGVLSRSKFELANTPAPPPSHHAPPQ